MIHGQDDEAAGKWEEFQNQPAGGEPQRKGSVQRSAPYSCQLAPRGAGSFSRFFKALTSRSQNAGRLCARRVRRPLGRRR